MSHRWGGGGGGGRYRMLKIKSKEGLAFKSIYFPWNWEMNGKWKGWIWRLRDDAHKKLSFCEVERDVKENRFRTEAKRDLRSTFERVTFLGLFKRSGERKYFPALAGLVGLVQYKRAIPFRPKLPPPPSYTGCLAGQYACLSIFSLWSLNGSIELHDCPGKNFHGRWVHG